MYKKVVLVVSSAIMLNAFGLSSLVGAVSGSGASATHSSNSGTKSRCIGRNAGGSTSLLQMATKKLLSIAVESALEKAVGVKGLKLPTPMQNTCEADARLKYLEKISGTFQDNIDEANRDILASVKQTKAIQTLQEEIAQKKKSLSEAEYKESVVEDNSKLLALIKNAKVKDKKKYSAAMGKLAIATPITGYMVLGWDKEILEFAKDNMVWGLQHVSAIKTIASQLTTTVKVLPSLTSLATSPMYNGKVDKKIAKIAAKKAIKADKKVAADAAAELDEMDS